MTEAQEVSAELTPAKEYWLANPNPKGLNKFEFAEAYAAHVTASLRSELERLTKERDQARKERDEEMLSAAQRYDSEVGHLQKQSLYYCQRMEAAERERDALKQALRNLLKALTPELTGRPKNVKKSTWAKEWDEAEALTGTEESQS